EALALLDGGLRPRLVVTDMKMPDITGDQLADAGRARPQASSTPVALLSSNHDAMEGVDGVVAKLDKPFSVAAVIDLLRQSEPGTNALPGGAARLPQPLRAPSPS